MTELEKNSEYMLILCFIFIWALTISLVLFNNSNKKLKQQLQSYQVNNQDNQLIKANDTLYYRINIRVDTTYFLSAPSNVHAIKIPGKRTTHNKNNSTSNSN